MPQHVEACRIQQRQVADIGNRGRTYCCGARRHRQFRRARGPGAAARKRSPLRPARSPLPAARGCTRVRRHRRSGSACGAPASRTTCPAGHAVPRWAIRRCGMRRRAKRPDPAPRPAGWRGVARRKRPPWHRADCAVAGARRLSQSSGARCLSPPARPDLRRRHRSGCGWRRGSAPSRLGGRRPSRSLRACRAFPSAVRTAQDAACLHQPVLLHSIVHLLHYWGQTVFKQVTSTGLQPLQNILRVR